MKRCVLIAEGQTHIGLSERRRIADAVTDHPYDLARDLMRTDQLNCIIRIRESSDDVGRAV
jgi:hypothetical protein